MPVDLRLDDDLAAFRAEVHAFLAEELHPERVAGHLDPTDLTGLDEAFEREHHRRAGARGYLGISAPVEHGGGGRPRSWAAVYTFEAAYFDAPSIDTAWTLCGAPVAAFGSPAELSTYLTRMIDGTLTGCIAYSEPQAGSDLAALTTTATRTGDGWRLDGRKALVTGAHKADVCVTAAISDPDVPRRDGVTMFVLDIPHPGVTVRRRRTLNDWTLSEIDFDGAVVPDDAVLGVVHGGWAQLTGAIASERSGMAHLGWATRVLDDLDDWIDGHPDEVDRAAREAVSRLHVELATGLHLASAVLWAQDRGEADMAAVAASKVFATELLQRVARVGTDVVGITALERSPLLDAASTAPLAGRLAWEVLERIHPTISVGANELQRDVIARAALRLPRARVEPGVDLDLSAAELSRRDDVRAALEAWGDRDRARAVLAGETGLDVALVRDLAGRGWFDASGRAGGASSTELALALVEVGRHPVPGPFHGALVAPGAVLAHVGRPDLAEAAARLDPWTAWCGDGSRVVATRAAGGWRLDGRVPVVPHAGPATALLVVARLDGGADGLFHVPADASGVATTPCDSVGDERPAHVDLAGVDVAGAALLADPFDAATALDGSVIALCAELLGAAEAALAVAVAYVSARELWGRPEGTYQAVQHRLADHHLDVLAMRAAVLDAAGRADLGLPFAAAASGAKVVCAEGALRTTAGVHQVHGGEGFYADRDAGLFYRRVRGLAPRLGDVRAHLARLDGLRRAARAAGPPT